MRDVSYVLFGYLLGSVLFARIAGRIFCGGDVTAHTPDGNPGTFNAFRNGGFRCGAVTLCGDLLKGLIPVWMYTRYGEVTTTGLALVMAAPVFGHIFPIFYRMRGGKGIATTFGCLLALLPFYQPLAILASCFLFFSVIVKISPNYYRTLWTSVCACLLMMILVPYTGIRVGFSLIVAAIFYRLWRSKEEKEACKVEMIWTR